MPSHEQLAEYMKDYRARNPHVRDRQTRLNRAKRKATQDLIDLHRGEYEVLLAARKRAEGLD